MNVNERLKILWRASVYPDRTAETALRSFLEMVLSEVVECYDESEELNIPFEKYVYDRFGIKEHVIEKMNIDLDEDLIDTLSDICDHRGITFNDIFLEAIMNQIEGAENGDTE